MAASHVIDPSSISADQLVATGLPADQADAVLRTILSLYRETHAPSIPTEDTTQSLWRLLSTRVLRPEHPFPLHRLLARWVYGNDLHPPLWFPTPDVAAATNVARFMQHKYKVYWGTAACWQLLGVATIMFNHPPLKGSTVL